MFYVFMENHNYSYEIYEIINLYFPGEKMHQVADKNDIPQGSFYIKSSIEISDSMVYGNCAIYKKDYNDYITLHNANTSIEIDNNLKKAEKHVVKVSTFTVLKDMTSLEMPWGILVGIRPTKIVNELKTQNIPVDDIKNILKKKYLLRNDKADLVIEVSNNNYSIINSDKKSVSLYIGIPFCPTRCIYCSFASYPIGKYAAYVDDYIKCLHYEIVSLQKLINQSGIRIENIYIGGGTPTSLNDKQFDILLQYLQDFTGQNIKEFTIEAGRPDTIDESKLLSMKKSGVTRISINPQSMNDSTLKRIGRCHTVSDTVNKFMMAREMGFDNINMDMILGLPVEDSASVENTVERLLKLSPENITVHTMAVKRASLLKEKMRDNIDIPMWDVKEVDSLMRYVNNTLHNSGYIPYYMYRQKMMVGNLENVGYCKEGYEGLYNIQMIEEKQSIIGIGVDSITKLILPDENRIERFANKKDIKEYIKTIVESTERKLNFISMLT